MGEAARSFSKSDTLRIRTADVADADALVRLINSAFRVERPFIEGDRIDVEGVRSYMAKGKFLAAGDSTALAACVYVELRGDRGYLGLLGVDPARQGTGLGRKMMDAAENYFREVGCQTVDLRVISARTPLTAFYRQLGYLEIGTAPFAPDVPLKVPCHYILMSRTLD
jgi:ribosomal protein S18 acetylase RimI-like enzyme